jgi:hypothetical protein
MKREIAAVFQMIRNSRKGTESWGTKFITKDRSNVTTRGG